MLLVDFHILGVRRGQWMLFWQPLLTTDKQISIKHRGWYKYINFYINLLNWNPLTEAMENECTRLPTTQAAWYHQIHVTGEASGSITMVVMFVGCLCRCGWTCDVTRSSYVKFGTKIIFRYYQRYLVSHIGVHHTILFTLTIGTCCFWDKNRVDKRRPR